MEIELSRSPLVIAGAAFLLGLFFASLLAGIKARKKALERDPRDLRIRSMEAENRVVQADIDKFKAEAARLQTTLEELVPDLEQRDRVVAEQKAKIDQLRMDLTSSVKKTRELRAELAERATENVHAEAKIREVETELSIVQASTDMISTGVLGFKYADEQDDEDKTAVLGESA